MFDHAMTITDGPVALRWSRGAAPSAVDGAVGSGLGARKVRDGSDVAILAVGSQLHASVEAAEQLSSQGLECACVGRPPRRTAPPSHAERSCRLSARRHRRGRHSSWWRRFGCRRCADAPHRCGFASRARWPSGPPSTISPTVTRGRSKAELGLGRLWHRGDDLQNN